MTERKLESRILYFVLFIFIGTLLVLIFCMQFPEIVQSGTKGRRERVLSSDIIDLIKSFEGIIGAVFGSAITLIVTHFLKRIGRVTSDISVVKIDMSRDVDGFNENTDNIDEAEKVFFELSVHFYNSYEIYKSVNDIEVKLLNEQKKLIHRIVPNDLEKEKKVSVFTFYEDADFINLPPNELVKRKLSFGFHEERMGIFREASHFVLSYSVHKNNAKKKKRVNKEFTVNFY